MLFTRPFWVVIWGFGLIVLASQTALAISTMDWESIKPYFQLSQTERQQWTAQQLERPLDDMSLVRIGLVNSDYLQSKYQEIMAMMADYEQSMAIANPNLDGSVVASQGQKKTEISLNQNLTDLLLSPIAQNAVRSRSEAEQTIFLQKLSDVAVEIKKAVYQFQAERCVYNRQKDYFQGSESAYELAKRQFKAGNISRLQLKTAEAVYQEALTMVENAKVALNESQFNLALLLRLAPNQTHFETLGTLSETLPDFPSKEILDEQIESRPDFHAWTLKQEAEQARLSMLGWKDAWGGVSAGIQYEQDSDGSRLLGPQFGVTLPLWNHGQWRQAENEALTRQLENQIDFQKIKTRYHVHQLLTQLEVKADQIRRTKTQLIPLKQEIVRLTQQHYNFMLMGVYELIRTQQDELQTLQAYDRQLAEFWGMWAELEAETGSFRVQTGDQK